MSRSFTGSVSVSELASLIALEFSKSEYFNGEVSPADCKNGIEFLKKNGFRSGNITKRIEEDLKKVEFDEENMEWEAKEVDEDGKKVIGFHTLANGLTFLGIQAGGDWESPLVYILYYDGTKLRGYIPTDGNTWNTKNKKAYGNDDEDEEAVDSKNAKERFGVEDFRDANWDQDKILADIEGHICPSNGRFVKPEGLEGVSVEEFNQEAKARQVKSEESQKAWEAHQKSMGSVLMVTMGGANAPGAGKSLVDILAEIQQETKLFDTEVEQLKGMKLSQEALDLAYKVRDVRLRSIVGKFCLVTNGIQSSI